MPIVTFSYASAMSLDEDYTHLHVETLDIPEAMHAGVADYIKTLQDADHRDKEQSHSADGKTEILVSNLEARGAKRVDLDGFAAVTVFHFDQEHEALAFRSGDVVQEDHPARKVLERFYDRGKQQMIKGYDRSGNLEFVKFKDDVHSHFLGNFDNPEEAFIEMGEKLTMHDSHPSVEQVSQHRLTFAHVAA